jgi:hypothetical protein
MLPVNGLRTLLRLLAASAAFFIYFQSRYTQNSCHALTPSGRACVRGTGETLAIALTKQPQSTAQENSKQNRTDKSFREGRAEQPWVHSQNMTPNLGFQNRQHVVISPKTTVGVPQWQDLPKG